MRRATAALMLASSCAFGAELPSTRDLAELSLEQLANLEVTSVSRRPESLADAPASIYVITADDIRRSGAASLAEALRLAPNLHVAQASASAYNIQARGINNNSANKLLVLVDGRSVYTPLFSGVFWDVQEPALEDIDRIEVISGPGGTLWGVNAVNGVINVITRSAAATQGTLLSVQAGNRSQTAMIRSGVPIGRGHFRAYAKYVNREQTRSADDREVDDAAHLQEAGFRADWEQPGGLVTLSGNVYNGKIGQPLPGSISITGVNLVLAPIPVSGANLLARWERGTGADSRMVIQAYVDRTRRTVPPTFAEKLDIVDVQAQWSGRLSADHTWVLGGEYRRGDDRVDNGAAFGFLPAAVDQAWASLFAQSELALAARTRLIMGARLERNDYTGTEFRPTLRITWKPVDEHMLWAAASRTVRAPSRLDRDPFIPSTPPFLLAGGPDVRSEVATVYEAGARGRALGLVSYSVTLFHADYDRLHTQEIAPSRTFIVFANSMEASTTGVEMWGSLQVSPTWRMSAGYTAQRESFRLKPGSNDLAAPGLASRDPAHTWSVRSSWNLAPRIEMDVAVRSVASLSDPTVPGYTVVDARVGWKARPDLEISIAGRNLGDGGHGEFTNVLTRTELAPSAYAGLRWNFDLR